MTILLSIIDVLVFFLPLVFAVAFVTIIERKQLAAMQRRFGPNIVGVYGILQPFADALKLIMKESVIPSQADKVLFYLAPISSLIFSLLGVAIIPLGAGLAITDFGMGVFYTLALSSLGVYGILFAGWSANSKYALLGSLRSSAAMISYELILSSAVFLIIIMTGSLNYTTIIESQTAIWLIVPLLPVFIFYFIAVLAETSRTPFDLQEAESELVSGFMTEHSSVPFVFFFLAEYTSILLFSTITAMFFLGGYLIGTEIFTNNSFLNIQSIILGLKANMIVFLFVWMRATLPRLRYDQLIELMWLSLLPIAVAFIILVPSILVAFDISPYTLYSMISIPVSFNIKRKSLNINIPIKRISININNNKNNVNNKNNINTNNNKNNHNYWKNLIDFDFDLLFFKNPIPLPKPILSVNLNNLTINNLQKFHNISGLYGTINLVNGKIYIASSIDLHKELFEYIENFNTSNKKLKKDIKEYEINNFQFVIYSMSNNNINNNNISELKVKEIKLIRLFLMNKRYKLYNCNYKFSNINKHTELLRDNNSYNIININNINNFFLKNINKLPDWLKIYITLTLVTSLIVKLLGFNVLEFFNSTYYLKMYVLISYSLGMFYLFLELYLLHKFSIKKVNVPTIFPDLLID